MTNPPAHKAESSPPASATIDERLVAIRRGAIDVSPVSGLTHQFYRYPARFSPQFAAAAIEALSEAGDLVLDPFMGGGTSVLEGLVRGRRMVGGDLNSLAVFVAQVKTTLLDAQERWSVRAWAARVVPGLSYSLELRDAATTICDERTRNLNIARARSIKKVLALCLESLTELPTPAAERFCRAVLLNAGQWALNSRATAPSASEFRVRVTTKATAMLDQLSDLSCALDRSEHEWHSAQLFNESADRIGALPPFSGGARARLIVTSPPYPGIHMLYHRWQVDGRKETPAPYWITAGQDGKGAAYYNFADRRTCGIDRYFASALSSFQSIRRVMADGGHVVQMIAFSDPTTQLKRYLSMMKEAGFTEITRTDAAGRRLRVWRQVPSRAWHATLKGTISSSREVVLVHQAM